MCSKHGVNNEGHVSHYLVQANPLSLPFLPLSILFSSSLTEASGFRGALMIAKKWLALV